MSNPTQLNETTEPRAKQPRIGERVYPSPLPMPIPFTPHSQNIAETVRQVDDLVQDPEDEKEEMMLVTTVAPGPHSEGCLLAGARREIYIHLLQNGPLPQVVRSLQKGSKLKRIC